MEDESDEWMSDDYYPPYLKETNTSNLRWILSQGYGLGKKLAITGVVISSAPILLPPLVVISALGFACSVPFGLVYASYAFTDKLMSMLLSSPTYPLIHEFETDPSDEENEQLSGFEGEFVVEEQEKERMEGLIELDGSGELRVDGLKYEDEYWAKDIDDYEKKLLEVKEESEKEDDDEYLADEEQKEENFPSEQGQNVEVLLEVNQAVFVVEESNVVGDEVEEDIVGGSTVLLEKIRDGDEIYGGVEEATYIEKKDNEERNDDKSVPLDTRDHGHNRALEMKEMNKELQEEPIDDKIAFLENIDDNRNRDIERKEINKEVNEEPIDDKNVSLENLDNGHRGNFVEGNKEDVKVEEVKGIQKEFENENVKSGEFGEDKGTNGNRNKNEIGGDENDKTTEEKNVKLEKLNGEVNETADSTSEQKKVKRRRGKKRGKASLDEKRLKVENKMDDTTTLDEENAGKDVLKPNKDTRVVNAESIQGSGKSVSNEHKPVADNKSEYKYNVEGLSVKKKEIAIDHINKTRESTEDKGSSVGDDKRATGVQYSDRLGENKDTGDNTAEEIMDFMDLPVSKGAEAKETNLPVRSNEVLPSEEKLWQQIDALRAIVGYKAKHDSTLIGELKALYIFTGVEPPTSFEDPHNLVEVNEKLHFLMSVVGVK